MRKYRHNELKEDFKSLLHKDLSEEELISGLLESFDNHVDSILIFLKNQAKSEYGFQLIKEYDRGFERGKAEALKELKAKNK